MQERIVESQWCVYVGEIKCRGIKYEIGYLNQSFVRPVRIVFRNRIRTKGSRNLQTVESHREIPKPKNSVGKSRSFRIIIQRERVFLLVDVMPNIRGVGKTFVRIGGRTGPLHLGQALP